jgi:hypothetical protein
MHSSKPGGILIGAYDGIEPLNEGSEFFFHFIILVAATDGSAQQPQLQD